MMWQGIIRYLKTTRFFVLRYFFVLVWRGALTNNKVIVVASSNKGKVSEIVRLLKEFPVRIKTLDDFPRIPPVEEDGLTFSDNAYKKASFTARVLGISAIADDSGLVVPALGGLPGVYSARYAGIGATDLQRCDKLLHQLKSCTDRRAYFKCVISVSVPQGKALTYEGKCNGIITKRAIGKNGFGYDPIFLCPRLNKTFGEMSIDEKMAISHRGIALKTLLKEFCKVLSWIDFQMSIGVGNDCLSEGFQK